MRTRFAALLLGAIAATSAAQTPDSPAQVADSVAQTPDSPAGAMSGRQAEVAARGESVMPFDLERTRHAFDATPDGGVLSVTARDASDTTQVRLVREHLASTSAMFARGDFSDPAFIHGDAMPGLAELRKGYERIDVKLANMDGGARIAFTTEDPALVDAIHRWFTAQTSDHGRHARP